MGRAIVYCRDCGKSLLEEDFKRGRAVRLDLDNYCAACCPVQTPTPRRLPAASPASSTRIPLPPSTRRSAAPAQDGLLWIAGAAVALALAVALIFVFSGRPQPAPGPPPPPRAVATPAAPAKPAPPPAPRATAPPAPSSPAALDVEDQMRRELAALRASRLDRDLQEARRLIERPEAPERSAEIDAFLDALARVAAERLPDVVKLRAFYEDRLAASAVVPAAAVAAPPPPARRDIPPGLEGRWTLDAFTDGFAEDVSGHGRHAKVVGHVALAPGRLGQAALFDGTDGHLELPRAAALDRLQEKTFSLSAWFKPADIPRGPEHLNGAFYAVVIKHGLHIGLSFSHEHGGVFEMMHWLKGVRRAGHFSDRPCPAGAWYHLAGVADYADGRTRLYVNGEAVLETAWADGERVADPGHARKPWRIGIALPKAKEWGWSARGAIDDVRLYSRALSAAEILSLSR